MEKFIHFNIAMLYRRHLVPTKHGDVRKQLPKQKPGSHIEMMPWARVEQCNSGYWVSKNSKNNLNLTLSIRFGLKIKFSIIMREALNQPDRRTTIYDLLYFFPVDQSKMGKDLNQHFLSHRKWLILDAYPETAYRILHRVGATW